MAGIKSFVKILLAGIMALALLSFVCFFYKYTPVRVISGDVATDYRWKPCSYLNTMEEGYASIKTDLNGYNNIHPDAISEDVDILIMGSSHMLAVEVGQYENVGYLLNDAFPEYHTYNIGMAGHFLSTNISNLEQAMKIYAPRKFVIIETDSINISEDDIDLVLSGEYPKLQSISNEIVNFAQTIFPATKKIAIQIDSWFKSGQTKSYVENKVRSSMYSDKLKSYIEIIGRISAEYNTKVILLYNPATSINYDGDIVVGSKDGLTQIYKDVCSKNGIEFIDMTEDFKKLYEEQHILAHGFINTGVGVGHLNKYGHRAVAERLAEVIMEDMSDES